LFTRQSLLLGCKFFLKRNQKKKPQKDLTFSSHLQLNDLGGEYGSLVVPPMRKESFPVIMSILLKSIAAQRISAIPEHYPIETEESLFRYQRASSSNPFCRSRSGGSQMGRLWSSTEEGFQF